MTQTALITGAARRIGRSVALSLAERGYDIVVHYHRSEQAALSLVGEIEARGRKAAAIAAHLEIPKQIEALIPRAVDMMGPLTLLINNASHFARDTLDTASYDSFLAHQQVNLYAPMALSQAFAAQAPAGSQILPLQEGGKIAVKRRVMVSGDELNDARQDFDPQSGNPVVSIRFNNAGGRKFGRVTAENVGKPFAIILDNVVISAPNINEPILGGSAQISGNFTVESGNELAISLRSGKLPVALKVIEESSVSAELGQDSIEKGVLAGTRTEFDVMKNLNHEKKKENRIVFFKLR